MATSKPRPKSACQSSRRSAGQKRSRAAIGEALVFAFQDTSNGSYEHVRAALLRRGWRQLKPGGVASLPAWKATPDLVWTLSPENIAFQSLAPQQIVNHYQGIECIATKIGLVASLREAGPALRVPPVAFSPRSYKLEDSQQVAEFVEDFRTTAAFNILEVFAQRGGAQLFPGEEAEQTLHLVQLCVQCVQCALRAVGSGEHENVDYDVSVHISDDDWVQILELSYKAAAVVTTAIGFGAVPAVHVAEQLARTEALVKEARRLTAVARVLWPQRTIDGHRNVWVVKAPDAARGTGIQLYHRLDEIVERQQGMRGRVVQKYIESPLLKPADTGGFKFDLRVWALLVGAQPMNVYCFNRCYARVCSKHYSSSVTTLQDPLVHLTNYSIHKDVRDNRRGEASEIWMEFEQLLHLLSGSSAIDQENGANAWSRRIWPRIREIVIGTAEAALPHLQLRSRSFELLGYDILLDRSMQPWLLEVNMSPSIASRGEVHDAMIASMSEGLVRLAVDPAGSSLPRRSSGEEPQVGDWELVAQLQAGSSRSCSSADTALRVDGHAISKIRMNVIDALCNQTAQATKIQRWWAAVRRLRAKKARRRLRSLLGMPTSPCSRGSNS